MKKIFVFTAIAAISFASCDSGTEATYEQTDSINQYTPAPDTARALPPLPTDSVQPTSNIQQPPNVLPVPVNLPKTNTSSVALNPEHGKPGHRCDIAVGAPLNGQPASASTPMPTITPTTQSSPQNAGNVRLNPPHGQPGHDCAVQVGQPLKN